MEFSTRMLLQEDSRLIYQTQNWCADPGTMESSDLVTTNRKALTINLDEPKYGTFAEIGAGQEVARHFFQAGGAAGTVAKSISAYDMKFSDAFYGKSARYVSRERLELMLNREYDLLVHRDRKSVV